MPVRCSIFGAFHFQAAVQLGRWSVKLGSWRTHWKAPVYGKRHDIWVGIGPHGDGTTTESRQPAPDAVATSLKRRPHETRAGASLGRPSGRPWAAAWHPLPLKFRIMSYHSHAPVHPACFSDDTVPGSRGHKDPSFFKRNVLQIGRRNDGSMWPLLRGVNGASLF